MTAIGATAVVVTAVKNDLKLLTIINIGSTIILWWSLYSLHLSDNCWLYTASHCSSRKGTQRPSFPVTNRVDRLGIELTIQRCECCMSGFIWPFPGGWIKRSLDSFKRQTCKVVCHWTKKTKILWYNKKIITFKKTIHECFTGSQTSNPKGNHLLQSLYNRV